MADQPTEQEARQSLWGVSAHLREAGMHISDYIEQLTALLFLKQYESNPRYHTKQRGIPEGASWADLMTVVNGGQVEDCAFLTEDELQEFTALEYFEETSDALRNDGPLLSEVFQSYQPKFGRSNTAFKNTVKDIDSLGIWETAPGENGEVDVSGLAYEELLQRYADKADGAGQYFTKRPLIKAMTDVVDPQFGETIHDPAAGTGGFLIEAHHHVRQNADEYQGQVDSAAIEEFEKGITGIELVSQTRRLGLMNMMQHGLYVFEDEDDGVQNYVRGDGLRDDTYGSSQSLSRENDVILANPPFGSNYNGTPTTEGATRVETNTVELLFVQHIMGALNDTGRAGVIVPEGVLFQSGAAKQVREHLLNNFNLHTILVLPDNTFHPYAGVDANVLFFERDSSGTDEVWYYDQRTDVENIKNSNPLTYEDHFADFVQNFALEDREGCDRFFAVPREEIDENGLDLNYKQYKDFADAHVYRDPETVLSELQDTTDEIGKELDALEGIVGGDA